MGCGFGHSQIGNEISVCLCAHLSLSLTKVTKNWSPMEKEIVLYRTFDSPVEANIVKDVLETNGVPCFLSNEIFSSVLPLTNSEVGAIRLNVFAEDVEKADTILSTTQLPESEK